MKPEEMQRWGLTTEEEVRWFQATKATLESPCGAVGTDDVRRFLRHIDHMRPYNEQAWASWEWLRRRYDPTWAADKTEMLRAAILETLNFSAMPGFPALPRLAENEGDLWRWLVDTEFNRSALHAASMIIVQALNTPRDSQVLIAIAAWCGSDTRARSLALQERWQDLFESVSSVFSFQVERDPSKRRALLEHMREKV